MSSKLLDIFVSVTHASKILTKPTSYIGKIKGIYRNTESVDMFCISYSKLEYDIVSSDNFEILFVDSNDEINCRKHQKYLLK